MIKYSAFCFVAMSALGLLSVMMSCGCLFLCVLVFLKTSHTWIRVLVGKSVQANILTRQLECKLWKLITSFSLMPKRCVNVVESLLSQAEYAQPADFPVSDLM